MFIFVPVPYSFNYCHVVVSFKVRKHDASVLFLSELPKGLLLVNASILFKEIQGLLLFNVSIFLFHLNKCLYLYWAISFSQEYSDGSSLHFTN